MPDTIPTDLVSVYDNAAKQWWLYYISTDQQLKIIGGPKEGQLEDQATNPPYTPSSISLDKLSPSVPKPKAGNSQLGVAEYLDNTGKAQTRVYYLDSDNNIVELGWNLQRQWFRGALTNAEFEALPDSVITCAVTKDQLKVYYRGKDKSGQARLWVAYVALNQEGWIRRPIMSF